MSLWPRGRAARRCRRAGSARRCVVLLLVIVRARGVVGIERGRLAAGPALHQREDGRQHGQRRDGRGDQAADDRPAQRGRLLAALAQAQGHRHHAGGHGAAGHEDRPQPAQRAFDGGRVRSGPLLAAMPLGEGDQQDRVGHRHADGHDRAHERLEVDRRAGEPEHQDHAGDHRGRRRDDDQGEPDRLEVRRQRAAG